MGWEMEHKVWGIISAVGVLSGELAQVKAWTRRGLSGAPGSRRPMGKQAELLGRK